jgi:hypothetical protein
MEWNERLIAEISQSSKNLQSFRRNLKDCVLRFAGIVSSLKLENHYVQRVEWSGISV